MDQSITYFSVKEPAGKRELSEYWEAHVGGPAPNVSASMLRFGLEWQLQAKEHGGLSTKTQKRLRLLATSTPTSEQASPGTRLVREWQGKPQVVTVGDGGEIIWNGQEWRSLSEVARAITGTRWSGPAFFGLKKKAEAA